MALLQLVRMSSRPEAEKRRYAAEYRHIMEDFLQRYGKWQDSYTLNDALTIFAFEAGALRSCESMEEKLRFLMKLVISRHITTFLHSLMVAEFAVRLMDCVVEEQPSLFVGYHGLADENDVRAHREQLKTTARTAALLHDIGKNGLIDIINTQYRSIDDIEFSIIRTHPGKGAEYLSTDPDLIRYRDVALGHHRFYNGKGGYPKDFDNTASPERILIDLITLCDCLDAGTDHLGRNYHSAKTVSQVLAEFQEGAGTRYNPKLTALLCSAQNAELRATLRTLAGSRREEIYYEAYSEFFEQN